MAALEEITAGCTIKGLTGGETVTVVGVRWYGSAVLEVTYKNQRGELAARLLYREDEARLEVRGARLPWTFDADSGELRLVSEAYRIHLAYLFDPYLAVHTSAVEPLPHQISAVYQEMLPRLPLRYILADDPGGREALPHRIPGEPDRAVAG